MQLAMFDTPPAEPRRKSSSRRVGGPSGAAKDKRGLQLRVERRPDSPPTRSDPRLSFLVPAPSSAEAEVDELQEARGPEPPVVIEEPTVERDEAGVELEVDDRAGEGDLVEREADLAPHPTRGKLMPPEVFTEDEVRALIAACSTRGITGHRNRALLAVLWRTGVRISEALELRPHDVDFKNGTVRVRLGKGLKPRTTVLSDLDALPLVERWLEERRKLQTVGEGAPLLCTLKGTPTDPSYARHLLPRLAKRAGLERRVHPHGLRHTHAADLALAGVPVLAIQQQLGHHSLTTTETYLRRVGVQLDLARMIRPSA
ncbi:MAG: tyrosine-type recombinase/integrase [Nannocystaceae bacterium]|nr:site-specific integrase [bacterium]